MCKPINIIHNLKLDRSYTGIQTLGAETVVDVMVYNEDFVCPASRSMPEESLVMQEASGSSTTELVLERPQLSPRTIAEHHVVPFENNIIVSQESIIPNHQPLEGSTVVVKCEPYCDQEQTNIILPVTEKSSSKPDPIVQLCDTKEKQSISKEPSDTPQLKSSFTAVTSAITSTTHVQTNKAEVDHDYFLTKNPNSSQAKEIPVTKKENQFKTIEVKKIIVSSPSILRKPASSSKESQSTLAQPSIHKAPVLVRCINKNGTVINLPLSLLRNAVVIKPYRTLKPGESLLRLPLRKPGEDVTAPSDTKTLSSKTLQVIQPVQLAKLCEKPPPPPPPPVEEEKKPSEQFLFNLILGKTRSSNWQSVRDCVRFLAQEFSLINPKAENSIFRSVYPFSTTSLEIFNSWNIGKRRGAEWSRAKLIHKTLTECNFPNNESWSTKRIFIWCRRQGYSPLSCWPTQNQATPETTQRTTIKVLQSTLCEIKLLNIPK